MLNLYALKNDKLENVSREEARSLGNALVWCDLNEPTKEEESFVESLLEIEIPTRDEMAEIELSNRLYQYNGAVFTTATMVTQADTPEPQTHAITFILTGATLLTLRYSEPFAFRAICRRMTVSRDKYYQGNTTLVELMELTVNRVADLLENTAHCLDTLNSVLFRPAIIDREARQQNVPDFEDLLRQVGIHGDLLSRIRESLISLTRLIGFISNTPYYDPLGDCHPRLLVLLKDIAALNEQANFLSNRVNFLLDAIFGMIGVQQTSIIKIFSVASVVFLPPTLVASIYGMNFDFMPELKWALGYPVSLAAMFLSALLPYLYFKKKNWL